MKGLHKPKLFSDPNCEYSQDEKNRILAKKCHQLDADDFLMIFSENLSVGEYHEVAYYIPSVLKYIGRSNGPDDGLPDVIENFLGWVRNNLANLKTGSYDAEILGALEDVLSRDLSGFVLEETSDGELHPIHCCRVFEIVSGLNRVMPERLLADEMLVRMRTGPSIPALSAWMIYLTYVYRRYGMSDVLFYSPYVEACCNQAQHICECAKVIASSGDLSKRDKLMLELWSWVAMGSDTPSKTRLN